MQNSSTPEKTWDPFKTENATFFIQASVFFCFGRISFELGIFMKVTVGW